MPALTTSREAVRDAWLGAQRSPNTVDGRARVQVYDAPFGLRRNDSMTLHQNSQAMFIRGQTGQPLFNDTATYWYAELPNHGVKLPAVGVKIRVLSVNGTSIRIRVTS